MCSSWSSMQRPILCLCQQFSKHAPGFESADCLQRPVEVHHLTFLLCLFFLTDKTKHTRNLSRVTQWKEPNSSPLTPRAVFYSLVPLSIGIWQQNLAALSFMISSYVFYITTRLTKLNFAVNDQYATHFSIIREVYNSSPSFMSHTGAFHFHDCELSKSNPWRYDWR